MTAGPVDELAPTTALPPVRRARRDDIGHLAAMLARAFDRDPLYTFLAGPGSERHARMAEGWSGILRFASARLVETWTTEDRAGAAIWLPPGYGGPSVLDGLRLVPAMARLAGWRRLRAVTDVLDTLERRRHHHVPGPHAYLSALGVDPARQGTGIGTALLRPVLDRCDRDGTPAYLETAVGRNVLLYERLGFEVIEELVLPRTDVHGWLMRRPIGG